MPLFTVLHSRLNAYIKAQTGDTDLQNVTVFESNRKYDSDDSKRLGKSRKQEPIL